MFFASITMCSHGSSATISTLPTSSAAVFPGGDEGPSVISIAAGTMKGTTPSPTLIIAMRILETIRYYLRAADELRSFIVSKFRPDRSRPKRDRKIIKLGHDKYREIPISIDCVAALPKRDPNSVKQLNVRPIPVN